MWLYSEEILQFIGDTKREIAKILCNELGVKVVGNRFHYGHSSYPLKIVVYNHKSMWGYFDPEFYEIGFHLRLMHLPKERQRQVIRHELAHYITHIDHGPDILPHGPEFKALCRKIGWDEEVGRACFHLETADTPPPSTPKKKEFLATLP